MKRFVIILATATAVIGLLVVLKTSSFGTDLAWRVSSGGTRLFPLATFAALIDSINPCAFSILLITIAFLFSLGMNRAGILRIGGIYILGIFVAYLFIGMGILGALHLFNTPHFMGKVGAVILVLMGVINIIGEFYPRFPIKLRIPVAAHPLMAQLMERISVVGAFFLGLVVGLCEFPCTGGPYLMILGLLHDTQTYMRGFWYLVWYNILFVLPLLIVLLIASDRVALEKVQMWRKNGTRTTRVVLGLVMVLLGILIYYW